MSINLLKTDLSKLKYNGNSLPNQYGVNHFLEYDGGAPIFAVVNGTVLQAPTLRIQDEAIRPRLKVSFDDETINKFDALYNRVLEIIKENKWIPDDSLSTEDLKRYIKYPYDAESYSYIDKQTEKEVQVDLPRHVQFEFQYEDANSKDKLKEYDAQLLEDEKKQKVTLSNLDEMRKFLTKKSTCRIIFKLSRVYIAKSKKKEPKYFGNIQHVPHLVRRTSSAPSRTDAPAAFSDDEDEGIDMSYDVAAADNNNAEHWDDLGVDMDKDPEDDF